MIEFKDLTDYCQALAIANKLSPTEESVWRSICRSYSKKFNEPLSACLNGSIDADQIIVLQEGRIVACGAHEDLLQRSSAYQDMIRAYEGKEALA